MKKQCTLYKELGICIWRTPILTGPAVKVVLIAYILNKFPPNLVFYDRGPPLARGGRPASVHGLRYSASKRPYRVQYTASKRPYHVQYTVSKRPYCVQYTASKRPYRVQYTASKRPYCVQYTYCL